MSSIITFKINEELHTIQDGEATSDLSLLDYIRKKAALKGTKAMCRDGGCGVCIVAAVKTPGDKAQAVNACLIPVLSCQDWEITTIEGLGDRKSGYHNLQETLAKNNGSQCGYCSPAWVMTMYSILENNPNITKLELEKSFDSNVCRCSGYRSILDSFKTSAKDNVKDIEDLAACKKTGEKCRKDTCDSDEWCLLNKGEFHVDKDETIKITLKDDKTWYKVLTLSGLHNLLDTMGMGEYMLLSGMYPNLLYPSTEDPDIYVDISAVEELKGSNFNDKLYIGAGNTITETITILQENKDRNLFKYIQQIEEHLKLIHNTAVRNVTTISTHLLAKHQCNDLSSDLIVLLETVGGKITVSNSDGVSEEMTPENFLESDLSGIVILNVSFPPLDDDNQLVTLRVMPKSQNAPARITAGFLFQLQNNDTVQKVSIVYDGVNPDMTHASETESYLIGKSLFTNETLQEALEKLNEDIVVEGCTDIKTQSVKKIALGLFYKSLLSLCPQDKMNDKYKSGATVLSRERGVSSGQQIYNKNAVLYPITEPLPNTDAVFQCSGEAVFTEDTTNLPREVFAAFVLSTVATGEIDSIDASKALSLKGVIAFYRAQDIPGINSFTPTKLSSNKSDEEVICSGTIKYFNQPIGIIVAETETLANKAAALVTAVYKNTKTPPVITINSAKGDTSRVITNKTASSTDKGSDVQKVIKGNNNIFGQYHFHLEPQVCITQPSDDGIEITTSTQWLDLVQIAVSQALNIQENRINMSIKRAGGSFGAKVSRATQIAVACSLVTFKLNRPCRMILPLSTNLKAIGKRLPCSSDYEVGVNNSGQIQYLTYNIYENDGHMVNESFIDIGWLSLNNCYDNARWNVKAYNVLTDTAKNSWSTGAGSLEFVAMTENIMEQISYEMSLDAIDVRLENITNNDIASDIKSIIETLKENAEYSKRKDDVTKFNTENRWKKRGLRFTPIAIPVNIGESYYVSVTVHHGDGTIFITHPAVDSGYGINTKVIQVCASSLNISMDKIRVRPANTITNINSSSTEENISSDAIAYGVQKCCNIIQDRLAPVRLALGDLVWDLLILLAYKRGVNLFASYNVSNKEQNNYNVYGATLSEVEVDILTGESEVLRVDIVEDLGQSINPQIDVAQIESAFLMGQGYWTCEDIEYDLQTGEQQTDGTWNYHVPQSRDIPQDFRVYLKENSYNKATAFGSKSTDHAICMSISVAFAIREAITSSRVDSGVPSTTWYNIDGAHTIDRIVLAANTDISEFKFS